MGNTRKPIAQQRVTVDGIAAEEDGGLSFVSAEPFSDTTNSAFEASVMGFIDSVDTMITVRGPPGPDRRWVPEDRPKHAHTHEIE